jgi:hypothetical protein
MQQSNLAKRPLCHKCEQEKTVKLCRLKAANGTIMVNWYCTACNAYAEQPVKWISHPLVALILQPYGKTIDDLHMIQDYTGQAEPCVICGSPNTEYNHWMPQTLAEREPVKPEWSQWSRQGAYLCRLHHQLWHKLVTPWMPGQSLP